MYVKVGEEIKIRVCRMREKNAGQNLNGYEKAVDFDFSLTEQATEQTLKI